MKNVFCPKKQEVITIDETKEKDWMTKYYHRSGKPFEWQPEQVVETVEETVVEESTEEEREEELKKALWAQYTKILDTPVPSNKKNDIGRLQNKIAMNVTTTEKAE